MSDRLDRIEAAIETIASRGADVRSPVHVVQDTPIVSALNNQLTWITMLGFVAGLLILFVYNDYTDTKVNSYGNTETLGIIATSVNSLVKSEEDREKTSEKSLELINTALDKIATLGIKVSQIELTRFDDTSAKELAETIKQYFNRELEVLKSTDSTLQLEYQGLKIAIDDLKFMKRDVEENKSLLKERNETVNKVKELDNRVINLEKERK